MRIVLETERLILRELVRNDYGNLCRLLQDEKAMYAYEGAFSSQEVNGWLDRQLMRYRDDGFGLWSMVGKKSGRWLGQCGITMQEYKHRRVPEIGYLLLPEYWHCGYATEAAVACREYGFDVLGFPEVYAIIRDTNLASQRVALRSGMERIDTIVKHYRGVMMPHWVFYVGKKVDSPREAVLE